MNVQVQFFSRLRDLAGVSEMELKIPIAWHRLPADVEELIGKMPMPLSVNGQ